MNRAKYFLIPESPHDIDRLWRQASHLGIADSPLWLSLEDAAAYRCAGSVFCAALSAGERARAEARGERE